MHISNEYNDMASTEFEKRKEEEYEMQLLGFHSRAVNATLKNVVYEAIESTCNKLCQTLQDKYNCDEDESKELKENKKKLIQTYNERAMPHLKLIESIVKKYISIPKNVLLDEDKCQSVQYTVEEYELLEERLKTLQQRAKKATLLNAALKEELTMVDQLESYIARSNKMCDLLENFSMHQDNNSKVMDEALKHYKDLYKQLLTMQPETEKVKYNSLEDFKGKDHNFDNL
ncbi:PREDICTED: protein MIS12 homolog [Polistes canadensis]|uniref:protein MIS12 homolog n=1 Tax=Polistes canadensis TaxID=91411 RepID=UPI000718BA0F|nr:PREDICTED: protein MIS12 homolog [Polistes canadensis]